VSRYKQKAADFSGLSTIPIAERGGKVRLEHLAGVYEKGDGLAAWLDKLPRLLAAGSLRAVATALGEARRKQRAILWGLGGHVIKCGLAPVLADLMRRGYATGFLLNGAAAIHDFEIGIAGMTSEDVEAVLPDGRFGTAEETGRHINEAIRDGARDGLGMGEALGRRLESLVRYPAQCLLTQAYRASVPVTVHVAVGTDTPHTYPQADGAAIGAATHQDFRLCATLVRELHDGGVYLNVGSAVLLPEVFLKAVSVVRNLGSPLAGFTTVNLDFLQHYRPRVNVVERPHAKSGGHGYTLTGHHEILVPLLAALLIEAE
jgi:hypothetical protein